MSSGKKNEKICHQQINFARNGQINSSKKKKENDIGQ